MTFFGRIKVRYRKVLSSCALILSCFVVCTYLIFNELPVTDEMGIYMINTEDERSLFTFHLRPWKVEKSMQTEVVCGKKQDIKWAMVFVVKSAISNFNRRKAIRHTWGNVKVYNGIVFETVFILGDTSDKTLTLKVIYENQIHGDILQFNVNDTAEHVPEKVLAGMQWAAKELPTNWLYTSIDDDIAVDFTKMVNFFYGVINNKFTLPTGAINFSSIPIVCEYSYQDRDPPNREPDSKWYMPWKDFPGRYWPVYCRGGAYTTTSYMAAKLYEVSRRTLRLYLDDVWITGFMRLKVERTNNNIMPGPGSQLKEGELHAEKWYSTSIVHHFWGNIADSLHSKMNVTLALIDSWKPLYKSIKEAVSCVEYTNSDKLSYSEIMAKP